MTHDVSALRLDLGAAAVSRRTTFFKVKTNKHQQNLRRAIKLR